jgi:hypothetical protein
MRKCWSLRGVYEGLHLVAGLVAVSWADGSHDTAAYAEPHYPKQAQHQSEA